MVQRRLLVVEDDVNKCAQLVDFVGRQFPHLEIAESHSYQTGLQAVLTGAFAVVLLDMTLPTYESDGGAGSGRIRAFAGRDMLVRIARSRIVTSVIVVTQFERFSEANEETVTLSQLSAEMQGAFGAVYVGTVHYQPTDRDWQPELERLINVALQGAAV